MTIYYLFTDIKSTVMVMQNGMRCEMIVNIE